MDCLISIVLALLRVMRMLIKLEIQEDMMMEVCVDVQIQFMFSVFLFMIVHSVMKMLVYGCCYFVRSIFFMFVTCLVFHHSHIPLIHIVSFILIHILYYPNTSPPHIPSHILVILLIFCLFSCAKSPRRGGL